MTYQEFKKAVEVFRLGERANLQQVRSRYRELAKDHHPDQGNDTDPQAIRRINLAYEILLQYCQGYQFCFNEEEFLQQVPAERLKRQFGWDAVWGGPREQEEN